MIGRPRSPNPQVIIRQNERTPESNYLSSLRQKSVEAREQQHQIQTRITYLQKENSALQSSITRDPRSTGTTIKIDGTVSSRRGDHDDDVYIAELEMKNDQLKADVQILEDSIERMKRLHAETPNIQKEEVLALTRENQMLKERLVAQPHQKAVDVDLISENTRLKEKIAQLEHEIDILRQRIAESQNTGQRQTNDSLLRDLRRLNQDNASLYDDNRLLMRENGQLKEEVERLKSSSQNLNESTIIKTLRTEIDNLRAALSQKESDWNQERIQLTKKIQSIPQESQRIAELIDVINGKNEEISRMNDEFTMVSQNRGPSKQLEEQLNEAYNEIEILNETLNKRQLELDSQMAENQDIAQKLKSLSVENRSLKEAGANNGSNDQSKIDFLSKKLQQSNEDYNKLIDIYEKLNERCLELENTHKIQVDQIEEMKTEIQNRENLIQRLKEDNKVLASKSEVNSPELESVQNSLAESRKTIYRLQDILKKKDKELEELESNCGMLQEEIKQVAYEKEILEEQIEELNSGQNDKASNELQRLRVENDNKKKKLRLVEGELLRLKDDVEEIMRENHILKKKNQAAEIDRDNLSKQLSELETEYGLIQEKKSLVENDMMNLKRRIREMQQQAESQQFDTHTTSKYKEALSQSQNEIVRLEEEHKKVVRRMLKEFEIKMEELADANHKKEEELSLIKQAQTEKANQERKGPFKDRINALLKENSRLRKDAEYATTNTEKLSKKQYLIDDLNRKLENQIRDNQRLESLLRNKMQELDASEEMRKGIEFEAVESKEEARLLRHRITEIEKEKNTIMRESLEPISDGRKMASQLKEENIQLMKNITVEREGAENLKIKLAEQSKKISQLSFMLNEKEISTKEIEALERDKQHYRIRFEEAQEQAQDARRLREKLETANDELNKLKETIIDAERTNMDLESKIRMIENGVHNGTPNKATDTKTIILESEVVELKQETAELRAKVKFLTSENNSLLEQSQGRLAELENIKVSK